MEDWRKIRPFEECSGFVRRDDEHPQVFEIVLAFAAEGDFGAGEDDWFAFHRRVDLSAEDEELMLDVARSHGFESVETYLAESTDGMTSLAVDCVLDRYYQGKLGVKRFGSNEEAYQFVADKADTRLFGVNPYTREPYYYRDLTDEVLACCSLLQDVYFVNCRLNGDEVNSLECRKAGLLLRSRVYEATADSAIAMVAIDNAKRGTRIEFDDGKKLAVLGWLRLAERMRIAWQNVLDKVQNEVLYGGRTLDGEDAATLQAEKEACRVLPSSASRPER